MINENTNEKIRLVNATLPSFNVEYTENNGIKTKGNSKWNPIEYDYDDLMMHEKKGN